MAAEKHVYKQKMEMPKNSIIFDAFLLIIISLFLPFWCPMLTSDAKSFFNFFGLTYLDGL